MKNFLRFIVFTVEQIIGFYIADTLANMIMSIEPTVDVFRIAKCVRIIVIAYHILLVSVIFMFMDMRRRHDILNSEYSKILLNNQED